MGYINILIGFLLIIIGIYLINYYQKLISKNKAGGLSFKIRTSGIGFIMIGLVLIIREFL